MKLTENLALKVAAVFAVFFAAVGLVIGAAGSIFAYESGIFNDPERSFYDSWFYESNINDLVYSLMYNYVYDEQFERDVSGGASRYSRIYSDARFYITEDFSDHSFSNAPDLDWSATVEESSVRRFYYAVGSFNDSGRPTEIFRQCDTYEQAVEPADAQGGGIITLTVAMPQKLTIYSDIYFLKLIYDFVAPRAFGLLWLAGLSVLTIAVAVVYLCCAAGHVRDKEGVTLSVIDRIPYDIYIGVAGTAVMFGLAFLFMLADAMLDNTSAYGYFMVGFLGLFGLVSLAVLSMLLTTVTRLKHGGILRNTFCFQLLRFSVNTVRGVFRWFGEAFKMIAMEWRVFILVGAFLCGSTMWAYIAGDTMNGVMILVMFFVDCVMLYICCAVSRWFKQIVKGGRAIAAGDVDYKINSVPMRGEMKTLAEDLNSIAGGMGIAVEQRIRSERLKTELITNVSHDIKTPLTSIINYVDLLKKEPLEGKAVEYADILEKHANRLKKLTADLIEASKAATGNISAELVPVNLCELVNQAVGEYSERLEAGGITPVVDMPDEARYIMADGKLFWRVIDNLLGNAAKYSQSGTRLYISVTDRGGDVVLDMKNISRERLNIAPEELTERFVRGDSARHTEGSGLGLNIAKSLTELQKGIFSIEIDGDLFKAEVAFGRVYISAGEGETD